MQSFNKFSLQLVFRWNHLSFPGLENEIIKFQDFPGFLNPYKPCKQVCIFILQPQIPWTTPRPICKQEDNGFISQEKKKNKKQKIHRERERERLFYRAAFKNDEVKILSEILRDSWT